ncbi:MAG: BatA domain-containing protein, partial [Bythopirellula sp.]
MSFSFQSLLTLGLPLIALPLLIHLSNLRRHRRVEWAAMEFLLESQKRNKKWILLRQLLLLLMRTAAIALVVFMLAGPVLKFQWGRFFGQGTTHHLVMLDDSYSMSDSWERTNAFDEAKRVVQQLLEQATQQPGYQKLTLLRFSTAGELTAGSETAGLEQPLDRRTLDQIIATLNKQPVAESDAGPLQAIQAALSLPEPTAEETRLVYLISDFRREQWQESQETSKLLSQLRDQAAQLQLIQCVDSTRPNLAIIALEPEAGIRSAGVEAWMQLTVANFGIAPATAVAADVLQDGHKLPAVQFEEIPPGEVVTRRFRVTFASAGDHQLQATLTNVQGSQGDAVALDNTRYFACTIPAEFPVLLVDASREGDDGYYLRTALSPGGNSKPGWNPQVQRPEFLRQHDQLNQFAAICLLDVPRLDESEVQALEHYVEQGGGLGVFLGPRVQRPFYNQRLYRDGAGLLPVQLDVPKQLVTLADQPTPDIEVSDHPLFRIFSGQRNSFLGVAAVNFYYSVAADWRVPENGKIAVLARLRNGAPYVVDKQFGAGRVVVQLSKLSPQKSELGSWSNWSLNPVFPVYANELIGYLSSSRRQLEQREVGAELALELPEADYQPEAEIRMPRRKGSDVQTVTPQVDDGKYVVNARKT